MTAFTVVIPTHDHADTLRYSVRSVQWQTCQDFELFIVGDGVPDRTREIARELIAADPRIRFFDFPKGKRLGELNRHEALKEAHGRLVCYQADDDLWFPEHLEVMAGLLEDHDLAHCMQIDVATDGGVTSWMFDAKADPLALQKMRGSATGFGLASGGHRLDAYRRLPMGWNPAPAGINSDLHFWLQFLEQPSCRYVSSKWPRVVHLSSVTRKQWDLTRRVDELAGWWDRIQTPAQRERLARECLLPLHDKLVRDAFASTSGAGLAREIGRLTKALGRILWNRARQSRTR
jgi:glycosyltransferase involved in cell wall biosynthesis